MDGHDIVTRRQFLVTGAAGAAALAASREAVAQAPAQPQKFQVNRPMSLVKAFEEDTLLAYAFNGEPVPPDHGFPVRAIVPGWVGINNVKWVGRIEVRNSVIDVPTTTKTYVLEGPDYPSKVVLRQQTIKSAVALPWGATLQAGRQRVRGFAWSPVGRISRVDYSLDRGATWQPAALREPNIARAWTRWDLEQRPTDNRPHELREQGVVMLGKVRSKPVPIQSAQRPSVSYRAKVAHRVVEALARGERADAPARARKRICDDVFVPT